MSNTNNFISDLHSVYRLAGFWFKVIIPVPELVARIQGEKQIGRMVAMSTLSYAHLFSYYNRKATLDCRSCSLWIKSPLQTKAHKTCLISLLKSVHSHGQASMLYTSIDADAICRFCAVSSVMAAKSRSSL